MNYAYIRVSTDRQNVENQRFEIQNFTNQKNIVINEWIEETISGIKKLEERLLNDLLQKMCKGDLLVVTEISRLGRNMMQIMSILHLCMEKDIQVLTIKERYELGNNINSKVLAFAFGLSAEIERNLISQRTKEALARKKSEGVILGRPVGSPARPYKLEGKLEEIKALRAKKVSICAIARIMNVHRLTVSSFLNKNSNLVD
jgi:DNA invertase Pin-like site-specific DNA recombinase